MTQGKLQKSISKLRYGRLLIHLEAWKTNRLIDQSTAHCSFLQDTCRRQNHVISCDHQKSLQLCAHVLSSCSQWSFIGQPRSIHFATCPRVTHHQKPWSGWNCTVRSALPVGKLTSNRRATAQCRRPLIPTESKAREKKIKGSRGKKEGEQETCLVLCISSVLCWWDACWCKLAF